MRADLASVLTTAAPRLLVPHLDVIIDGLGDAWSPYSCEACVQVLRKMQGHELLTPTLVHSYDAKLVSTMNDESCDSSVRDFLATEIMPTAFAPGSFGAASASEDFLRHASAESTAATSGPSSSSRSGGSGSCSAMEQLRRVLGAEPNDADLFALLASTGNDVNAAVELHMQRQDQEMADPSPSAEPMAVGQLDGTLPSDPAARPVKMPRLK